MRKNLIGAAATTQARGLRKQEWLDIETVARVELTSEDPKFPIESALVSAKEPGWRAAEKGEQIIRIVLDERIDLMRIRLEFSETENDRTQEFTLRYRTETDGPLNEIVRQQWVFSPRGSTMEIEDYQVHLNGVSVLELAVKPDLTPDNALASLALWRMA